MGGVGSLYWGRSQTPYRTLATSGPAPVISTLGPSTNRDLKMILCPKSWKDFQHYKDRNPPWIRLHKALLDNYDFQCLPVASRALAPMLWLVASDAIDGQFDGSHEKLAFRLRQTEQEIQKALKPLIDKGFFEVVQHASDLLAESKQSAVPETETLQRQRQSKDSPPDGVSDSVWRDFLRIRKAKRAPMTDTALSGIRAEAEKAGLTLQQALQTCCARGWQGFKAEWLETQAGRLSVVGVTVPGPQGPDPALAKLDEDAKRAAPPPAEIREKMAQLRLTAKGAH